ncbi:MAG: HAD-IA family hydrolase [archaeon]|nr:HAD-IA family hydrolase [archaeon]
MRGETFHHYRDRAQRFFVFDMFGTLVINERNTVEPIFEVLCTYYPGVDPSDLSHAYHEFTREFKSTHSNMELSIDRIIERLDEVFGFHNDPDSMEDPLLRNTRLYTAAPGAEDLLRYLKDNGYRVGVLSNSRYHSRTIRGILEDEGLLGYIDEVVSSADIGFRKPHPEAYLDILRRMGAEPGKAYFAGDNIAKDYYGPLAVSFRGAVLISPEIAGQNLMRVDRIGDIIGLFDSDDR